MNRPFRAVASLIVAFATDSLGGEGYSFTPIDVPAGFSNPQASAISPDGNWIVGNVGNGFGGSVNGSGAFRWSMDTGFQLLGSSANQPASARGVTDGGLAVGLQRPDTLGNGDSQAVEWISPTQIVPIPVLSGAPFESEANDVSADGGIVVGRMATNPGPNFEYRAFRTVNDFPVSLGLLGGTSGTSSASSASLDGTKIVGSSTVNGAGSRTEAFFWTQSTGMMPLGVLPGGNSSSATAVSGDGSTVTGLSLDFSANSHGFVWTAENGMIELVPSPGVTSVIPRGISLDGSVIVGFASFLGEVSSDAFYWSEELGFVKLEDLLQNQGVNLDGWNLTDALDVSDDGLTVTGRGQQNGQSGSWVATIPEPTAALLLMFATVIGASFCRRD